MTLTALAQFLPRARALDWTVAPDRPAEGWLRRLGQTPRVIERLWRPLTLAALNTPLHEASAQILASVLRDSLGAHAGASETEALPTPAPATEICLECLAKAAALGRALVPRV